MTFANNSLGQIFADRGYTYKVTVKPAKTPISRDEVKTFAKIRTTTDDALILILINAAVRYAEQITRRDFITRTYETFRDLFPGTFQGFHHGFNSFSEHINPFGDSGNFGFEIRKSPLQSIEEIKYLDTAGATIVVASTVFYNTVEEDYSSVLTVPGKTWPTDAEERLQAINIKFKSGFGDDPEDVPDDLRDALLMHVTFLYENRGDCEDVCNGSSGCGPKTTPSASKAIYLQNRIENL